MHLDEFSRTKHGTLPLVDDLTIQRFEEQLKYRFTDDFRSEIQRVNGAIFKPDLTSRFLKYKLYQLLSLDGMLKAVDRISSLVSSAGISDRFVPFGVDRALNFLCFRVSSVGYGSSVWSLYDDPLEIQFVCASFRELVESLAQEESCEVERLARLPLPEFIASLEAVGINARCKSGLPLIRQTIRAKNFDAFNLLIEKVLICRVV